MAAVTDRCGTPAAAGLATADGLDVRCTGLGVILGGQRVLDGLDLHVPAGTITTVVGASGSGKSTLFKVVMGVQALDEGSVTIGRHDLRDAPEAELVELRRRVSVLHSFRPGSDDPASPWLTVRENLLANLYEKHVGAAGDDTGPALWAHGVAKAEARPELVERAEEWLRRLDLVDVADQKPGELSPVDLRRASIAAALSVDVPLYLLDGPDIALDEAHRAGIIEALRHTHERTGATMMIVTEDLVLTEAVSHRVAVLASGQVAFSGPAAEAFADVSYAVRHAPSDTAAEAAVDGEGGVDDLAERAETTDQDALVGAGSVRQRVLNTAFTVAAFALIILMFLLVTPRG